MGRRSAEHLAAAGAQLTVSSRTPEHARTLVEDLGAGAEAVPWEERLRSLDDAAALVVAVRAEGTVFSTADVRSLAASRAAVSGEVAPLFVFDFGVPRSVSADLEEAPWVTVRGVDDLTKVTAKGQKLRRQAAEHASRTVATLADEYWAESRERRAVPLIRSLHAKAEEIRHDEVAKTLRRLPHLEERERGEIERLAHRIVARLLNEPTVAIRTGARDDNAEVLLRSAAALFGLGEGTNEAADDTRHPA